MLSVFGIGAAIVAVLSICALVLYFCVMKRRVVVDKALAVLDVLLRARLEILYDTQPDEVREMCADFATLETRNLLQSVVQIKIEPLDEILRENIAETDVAAVEYNEAAAVYNAYIAKFPAKIMAILLGMTQEKDI